MLVFEQHVERLLNGLAQMQEAGHAGAPIPGPLRYRFQRFDNDEWQMMEAHIHNLTDDPFVQGMVVITRPVEGELDGVERRRGRLRLGHRGHE